MHLPQQQLVLLHLGAFQVEAPYALDADPQQTVVLLHEVADHCFAADRRDHRWRLANLLALQDADHPKAFALLHAAPDHVQVACLENLQIEKATREQHGIERKQR
ncbi:hypothetical protein D3C79_878020 [compost metagenome]